MKAPAFRVPVGLLVLTAAVLSASLVTSSQARAQNAPPLAVFDVPLGATLDQVRNLAAARNHPARNYDQRLVSIDNLPGTDHVSVASSWAGFEGRIENFAFHFTGPPGEGRAWMGGTIQAFGRTTAPSTQAPLTRDVIAALLARYGPPSLDGGSQYYWFWDINGRPMPARVNDICYLAMGKAQGEHRGLSTHSAIGNPEGFQMARRGGCAYGVRAEIFDNRGRTARLRTRVGDFKAGQNAWVLTSRHVAAISPEADR